MLTTRHTPPLESDQASSLVVKPQEQQDLGPARSIRSSAASFRSARSKHAARRNVRLGCMSDPILEDSISDHSLGLASTQSLAGSLLDYPMENGRRYHSNEKDAYFMPNDEREADRLTVSHQMHLTLLSGRLHLAPLPDNISYILDIGTGTGDWAIDMAEAFPNAEVIGMDLSVIQPNAVPANVYFEVENAEGEWEYTQEFDHIYIRDLCGAIDDWPALYAQAFKFLKPGGYIEVVEHDEPELPEGGSGRAKDLKETFFAACAASGRPYNTEHLAENIFRDIGFADVESHRFEMPIGGPGLHSEDEKWLAKLGLVTVTDGIEAFVLRPLTRWAGWSVEQVNEIVKNVTEDFMATSDLPSGGYTPICVVIARKPL